MRSRILVVLKLKAEVYKFFSIIFSGVDQSVFIYNHLREESAPIKVSEPIHLLKSEGEISLDDLSIKSSDQGSSIHFSIHPNRLYLKKRTKDGREQHLADEFEPQPFKNGFRMHCVLSPAPPNLLPIFTKKRNNEEIEVFEWSSDLPPLVSVYEIHKSVKVDRINGILPPASESRIIESDGFHPTLVLQIKPSNSKLWHPSLSYFGRMLKKRPICKPDLQRIINYNKLDFDISSLPENAEITDFKIKR